MPRYKVGDRVQLADKVSGFPHLNKQTTCVTKVVEGGYYVPDPHSEYPLYVYEGEIVGLAHETSVSSTTTLTPGDYSATVHQDGSVTLTPKPRTPQIGEVWEDTDDGTMLFVTDQRDFNQDPWCIPLNGDDCGEYEPYTLSSLRFAFPSLRDYLKNRTE